MLGSRGKPREYRGINAATGKLELDALDKLRKAATSTTQWEIVPLVQRTTLYRNNQFQMISGYCCAIKAKHCDIHFKYPVLAFLWLISGRSLKDHYDGIACKAVLGSWMLSWCDYWEERDGLDSEAARADLSALLILWQEDTAEIEALHATIRRELIVLSVQCSSVDFNELSDRHILRQLRLHPQKYGVKGLDKVGVSAHWRSTASSSTATVDADPKRTQVRGGAYREFLKEVTRDEGVNINKVGLGKRYRDLPESEHQRFAHVAHITRARVGTADGGPSDSKKDNAKLMRQRESESRRLALTNEIEGNPEMSAADSLAEWRIDDSVDFDTGIRTIKRSLKCAAEADSVVDALCQNCIEDHDTNVRGDCGAIPSLPTPIADILGDNWRVLPHAQFLNVKHVRGSFDAVSDAVGTIAKVHGQSKLLAPIHQKLQSYRDAVHAPCNHDQMQPLPPSHDGHRELLCNEAGFCVHGHDGREVIAQRT